MHDETGDKLALTDVYGKLYITDSATNRVLLNEQISYRRIGSIGWNDNLIALGSKDKLIRLYDVRDHHFRAV